MISSSDMDLYQRACEILIKNDFLFEKNYNGWHSGTKYVSEEYLRLFPRYALDHVGLHMDHEEEE